MTNEIHAVTGAFGYSGKYIARKLLARGRRVITLTNSPDRPNPFGEAVRAIPYSFDRPDELVRSLEGVQVLYNTYWVRFDYGSFSHHKAVANTEILFDAAKRAGVDRIVHVSITNPDERSRLPYFSGKAKLERALVETGISHATLRPTVLFGREDILINNIAWLLRHLPVFGLFGTGNYRLQPIYVDDLADLAIEQGEKRENVVINAIGPETFTYREMVERIRHIIATHALIVPAPPFAALLAARVVGSFMHDVVLTREEIEGLMAGLLYVDAPPAGRVKLTEWTREHRDTLGRRYTSELQRRRDRSITYPSN